MRSRSQERRIKLEVGAIELTFIENLFHYKCKKTNHIETWTTFAATCDLIFGHLNILIYAHISDSLQMRILPIYQICEKILQEMITLPDMYGNLAYEFFKLWPSLATGLYLAKHEPDAGIGFLEALLADLRPEFLQTFYYTSLDHLCDTVPGSRIAIELSGLWKMASHPFVDMEAGVDKILERGNVRVNIDPQSVEDITITFRYHFIRNYWTKHHSWPPLRIYDDAPSTLRECYSNNSWDGLNLIPSMFKYLDFEQIFDFNYHIDLLDLLSDKSICADIYQLSREINTQAHWRKYNSGVYHIGIQRSKRLLIEILTRPEVSTKQIIDNLEQNRGFSAEDRVIVLVAKERELKIEPRFFCKTSLNARLWQVMTESNVADKVLPYCPFQTMTSSLQDVLLRMSKLSGSLVGGGDESRYISVNIDFSSWNLRFRHETMGPILTDLDDMFGLSFTYYYTHLFPRESLILVQDSFDPPRYNRDTIFEEGKRFFFGFESWFEGMRQKVWTCFTAALLLMVARRSKYHVSVTGQGDNQIVLIRIPPQYILDERNMTSYDYVREYLAELETVCNRVNLPIKTDESWMSATCVEYSRQTFLLGAQIPSGLKKISRLFATANSDMPTTGGDVASISAAGSSCADVDYTPDPSFLTTMIETCQTLEISWPTFWQTLTFHEKVLFLIKPRITGGLPISQYTEYLIRGSQDPLTNAISFHDYIYNYQNTYTTSINLLRIELDMHHDYLLLIKDPLSLPLAMPVQPENVLKNAVKSFLSTSVSNIRIKTIIESVNESAERQLVDTLLNIVPLNTRVCNQIFSFSTPALLEKIIGRFSSTQSVTGLALKSSKPVIDLEDINIEDILESWSDRKQDIDYEHLPDQLMIIDRECELWYTDAIIRWRKRKWTSTKLLSGDLIDENNIECSFIFSEKLRRLAWRLPIEYVTQPCIFEQCLLKRYSGLTCDELPRSVYIKLAAGSNRHTTRGPYLPYLGSETREKERLPVLQTVYVQDVLTTVKNIVTKFEWFADLNDINIMQLRDILIAEKTGIHINQLERVSGTIYGGRPEHRLRNPVSRPGASHCGLINFPTYVYFSSNSALKYSQSAEDYTIMFQLIYLASSALLSLGVSSGLVKDSESEWASVIRCDLCTKPIPPIKYTLSKPSFYLGIDIPEKIEEIHILPALRHTSMAEVSPSIGYAALLGYKAVSRMKAYDRSELLVYEHSLGPEHSDSGQFLNLTEFRLIDLSTFFDTIAINLGSLSSFISPSDHIPFNVFHLPDKNPHYSYGILEGISRAIIQTRRTHVLYQLYPFLRKRYSCSVDISGMSRILVSILGYLREDNQSKALLRSNYIINSCSKNSFAFQWARVINCHLSVGSYKRRRLYENILAVLEGLSDLGNIHLLPENHPLYPYLKMCPTILPDEGSICVSLREKAKLLPVQTLVPHIHEPKTDIFEYPAGMFDSVPSIVVPIEKGSLKDEVGVFDIPENVINISHLFRFVGSVSTAPSKYLEVLAGSSAFRSLQLKMFDKLTSVICLAEGSGSVANWLMHIFPRGMLFYNSLLPGYEAGFDPALFMPPACVQDSCYVAPRVVPPLQLNRHGKDLANNAAVSGLLKTISETKIQVGIDTTSIITMDAERPIQFSDYFRILENTLKICVHQSNVETICVIKLFYTESAAQSIISQAPLYYDSCRIVKPISSADTSSEVFLLLCEYNGTVWRDMEKGYTSNSALNALRIIHHRRSKRIFEYGLKAYINRTLSWRSSLRNAFVSDKCLSIYQQDMIQLGLIGDPVSGIDREITMRCNQIKKGILSSTYNTLLMSMGYELQKLVMQDNRKDVFDYPLTRLHTYLVYLHLMKLPLDRSVAIVSGLVPIEICLPHIHTEKDQNTLCLEPDHIGRKHVFMCTLGAQDILTSEAKRILRVLSVFKDGAI